MIPTMSDLPHQLYRATQVRQLDRVAIEEFKIPGLTLMERAGKVAFSALQQHYPKARNIAVMCGVGNNAGDGFVVARLAAEAGMNPIVYHVGDKSKLKGDALQAYQELTKTGVKTLGYTDADLSSAQVIVDALLGTGLHGDVSGEWRAAIETINRCGRPVIALDIPSGLHADTGRILGAAVQTAITVTFIGLKQGLFTAQGPDVCGEIIYADLEVPAQVFAGVLPSAQRLDSYVLQKLGRRSRGAHKGHFGHVMVIGGERGMSGAARMAGEAAARVGAGLVSIATRAEHAAILSSACPELMCHGVENKRQLRPLLDKANVIAVGPGLGQGPWAQELFGAALETDLPIVVDADGLNLLANEPVRKDNWILTPHPGEAARLLNSQAGKIQLDRFAAIRDLQQRYGGVVVLKGAGTLVSGMDLGISLCSDGNPGMASGGMGDVLTGVISGLLAQGLSLKDAANAGVYLHAVAGDRAARFGERGMLATDLMQEVRFLINV
jgi:hydroxyethylthiazole kinase-like uncharacterized protein yjeF